jgi:5,5'-dehydrodivanillate O-demethylase
MVLTREENELLTRVGPGTPAGELFRRYWHPIAVARELTDERPTKFIRFLGEDLVLFKDKSGNVGLIQDHCVHRGASLLYGRVEERGIACAYHGWLYDTKGNCLECPAEPEGSKFHLTVKARAYPVQKYIGLCWAYLGPQPAPVIPKYDVWARQDGRRKIVVYPQLAANWLQPMENSADPWHAEILHQQSKSRGKPILSTTRGCVDDVESVDFFECSYGLMKKRVQKTGQVGIHPIIFPNILREGNATQFRLPTDDTSTDSIFVHFIPGRPDGSDDDPEVEYKAPFKTPPDAVHPFARHRVGEVMPQDFMAWETQGPLANREAERLATSDRGVVMFREMLRAEIAKVQEGIDPRGVLRDPDHDIIDTHLMEDIQEMVANGRIRW